MTEQEIRRLLSEYAPEITRELDPAEPVTTDNLRALARALRRHRRHAEAAQVDRLITGRTAA